MARPINPHPVSPGPGFGPGGSRPGGLKAVRAVRNLVWRSRKALVAVAVVSVLGTSAAGAKLWSDVPLPPKKAREQPTYLCDREHTKNCGPDNAFAELAAAKAGTWVEYEQIPDVMIQALIAAEDKDFFRHQGVDPTGIARALWHDVRSGGGGMQGGSTLTQQLIKTISEDDAPTVSRKVKEAVQAMKLEQDESKEDIITRYLNSIYFGRNARGIDAAVRAYFGPDMRVEDIKLEHAAYLAAIIREPEYVDANRAPDDPKRQEQQDYATRRRADVLDTMVEELYVTAADRDRVKAMGWDYVIRQDQQVKGEIRRHQDIGGYYWRQYVMDWIGANLSEVISEEQLASGGLRIYTSMDPKLQRYAFDAVAKVLPTPGGPEASLASIDDQGFLRAMFPRRDRESFGTNLAVQAERAPGSSFKPVVLSQYLQTEGRHLYDEYENPLTLPIPDEPAVSSIEGDATPFPVDLEYATVISSNTVYAQVQQEISKEATVELAKKFGFRDETFHETLTKTVRLALGAAVDVSPLDMASAYSVFANRGERYEKGPFPVVKITGSDGRPLWEAPPQRTRVIPDEVADQVNYVLRQVVESTDEPRGTGTRAAVPGQTVAGKTGTVAIEESVHKDNSDAWFAGYTCKLTAAVWMGYPDALAEGGLRPIGMVEGVKPVNGGTLPAMIFAEYMKQATQGLESCPFERPAIANPPATIPPVMDWGQRAWDRWLGREPDDEDEPSTTRRRPFQPWEPEVTTTTRRGGGRPTTTEFDDPTTTFDFDEGFPGLGNR